MRKNTGIRTGFTLVELLVVMGLIGIVAAIGAASLRTSEIDATRKGANEVFELLRSSRYIATRQNRAVVVRVYQHGSTHNGTTTRGRVEAWLALNANCPPDPAGGAVNLASPMITVGGTPILTVDFARPTGNPPYTGGADTSEYPGIGRVTPATLHHSDGGQAGSDLCFLPNGRILNRATNRPIAPVLGSDAEDMAGEARIIVQYMPNPVVNSDGIIRRPIALDEPLAVPYVMIDIPYTGLVTIPQGESQ